MAPNIDQYGHLPTGEDVEIFEPGHTADKHKAPMGDAVSPEHMSRRLLAFGKGRRIKPQQLIGPNTIEVCPTHIKKT